MELRRDRRPEATRDSHAFVAPTNGPLRPMCNRGGRAAPYLPPLSQVAGLPACGAHKARGSLAEATSPVPERPSERSCQSARGNGGRQKKRSFSGRIADRLRVNVGRFSLHQDPSRPDVLATSTGRRRAHETSKMSGIDKSQPGNGLWSLVDRICAEQHARWLQSDRTRVEDYLAAHPALKENDEACLDLIYNELLLAEELGPPIDVQDYCRRFPQYAERLKRQLEVRRLLDGQRLSDGSSELFLRSSDDWDEDASRQENDSEFFGTERFTVLQRLGKGGMGTVYLAFDNFWQQRVALKTFRRADAGEIFRLKHEFRVLEDLSHPNLVQFFELFSADDRYFFTMELIDGGDFLSYCRRSGKGAEGAGVHEPSVRNALTQLASGLIALHSAGLLHCDIKPSNVLVTLSGRVVLLDFGLMRTHQWEIEASPGYLQGTAAYMAAEQFRGERASPASDWYGVGVMLFAARNQPAPVHRNGSRHPGGQEPARSAFAPRAESGRAGRSQPACERIAPARPGAAADGRRGVAPTWGSGRPPHRDRAGISLRRPRGGIAAHSTSVRPRGGRPDRRPVVARRLRVGQEALAERFAASLDGRKDVLLLSGRCYQRESVPFKAIDRLVDQLSQSLRSWPADEVRELLPDETPLLAAMFPVLQRAPAVAGFSRSSPSSVDPQMARCGALRSFRELLTRISRRTTVVLLIDDLQLSDRDSVDLLTELLGAENSPPLLLLACYRGDEGDLGLVERIERIPATDAAASNASPSTTCRNKTRGPWPSRSSDFPASPFPKTPACSSASRAATLFCCWNWPGSCGPIAEAGRAPSRRTRYFGIGSGGFPNVRSGCLP